MLPPATPAWVYETEHKPKWESHSHTAKTVLVTLTKACLIMSNITILSNHIMKALSYWMLTFWKCSEWFLLHISSKEASITWNCCWAENAADTLGGSCVAIATGVTVCPSFPVTTFTWEVGIETDERYKAREKYILTFPNEKESNISIQRKVVSRVTKTSHDDDYFYNMDLLIYFKIYSFMNLYIYLDFFFGGGGGGG